MDRMDLYQVAHRQLENMEMMGEVITTLNFMRPQFACETV